MFDKHRVAALKDVVRDVLSRDPEASGMGITGKTMMEAAESLDLGLAAVQIIQQVLPTLRRLREMDGAKGQHSVMVHTLLAQCEGLLAAAGFQTALPGLRATQFEVACSRKDCRARLTGSDVDTVHKFFRQEGWTFADGVLCHRCTVAHLPELHGLAYSDTLTQVVDVAISLGAPETEGAVITATQLKKRESPDPEPELVLPSGQGKLFGE